MIKAIIVEDEFYIRKGLISLINSLNNDILIVGECSSVKEATIVVNACKPDLIFLDINLSDGNAFDFLEQTPDLNFKVIFITSHDEYALKALKLGAVDYILKPIDIDELDIAIKKLKKETSFNNDQKQIQTVKQALNNERLVVSLQDGYQIINYNELKFCKSENGYTTFYLSNKKTILASKPLKYFVEKLPAAKFVRTHQSCLVNLDYIDRYDKSGVVILKDNYRIPVSIRKKEEFLSKLLNKN